MRKEHDMRALAAVGIALALSLATASAGDFEDGAQAYMARDYGKALASWQKAAAQGNVSAQTTLGIMYEKGQGAAVDYKQATFWYRKAAERGNADDLRTKARESDIHVQRRKCICGPYSAEDSSPSQEEKWILKI